MQFDHGCQFIMASNSLVAVQVREWELQRKLSSTQASLIMLPWSNMRYFSKLAPNTVAEAYMCSQRFRPCSYAPLDFVDASSALLLLTGLSLAEILLCCLQAF